MSQPFETSDLFLVQLSIH